MADTSQSTACRVVLIDDHPIVLQGVRHLLADVAEFQVIAECTSAEAGVNTVRRDQPDLVLLDLRIAEALAPDVCRGILSAAPDAKVIILTAYDDEALLRACLQAGASGVMLKDAQGLELVRALLRVRAGEMVLDERLSVTRARQRVTSAADDAVYEPLTQREHEVLRLMAQGLVGKEIATSMSLAPNTVRSYAQSVLNKLHASSRVQALATARRLRLI